MDATVKAGLLDLVDYAVAQGWTRRRAVDLLGLDEERARRWGHRRVTGRLEDTRPGGAPVHGILPEEQAVVCV